MSYRLPPLGALRAFEAASRHLSFKLAAEELHVTPAAISQQIKTLEAYLGVSLFRRLTRALELTPQGEAMLPKLREGFECLTAAVETSRKDDEGVLTVSAPPSFAARWLLPRLPRFAELHPEVKLRLASGSAAVDRRGEAKMLAAHASDPRESDCSLAIRYGLGNYPGFVVEPIFAPSWLPVCSPHLPTSEKPLHEPADLRHHVLIHDETIDDEERQPSWQEWLQGAGGGGVDATRGLRFSNAVLTIEAALAGQGVALALLPLVAADIAAGRLIVPFQYAVPSPYAYFMLIHRASVGRRSVAAFRAWLRAEADANSAEQGV